MKTTKANIDKAVSGSSKIEGYNLRKAKNNKKVIRLLKKHGRAHSL